MINLSEVTIDYSEVVPTYRQSPEFYTYGGFNVIATVSRGSREIHVAANGEMDLTIPNITKEGELTDEGAIRVRYASDLFDVGIRDDIQFSQLIKTCGYAGWQTYRMNPWWEIYSEADQDGIVSDSDNFYDAVDVAIGLLFDEEYWEGYE